jgi:hypothetical protein
VKRLLLILLLWSPLQAIQKIDLLITQHARNNTDIRVMRNCYTKVAAGQYALLQDHIDTNVIINFAGEVFLTIGSDNRCDVYQVYENGHSEFIITLKLD